MLNECADTLFSVVEILFDENKGVALYNHNTGRTVNHLNEFLTACRQLYLK